MANSDKYTEDKLINDMINAYVIRLETNRFPQLGSLVLMKKVALLHQSMKKLWK